jgi:hypothetical protein
MPQQYKMVQVPPSVAGKLSGGGEEAAEYLQDIANKMAADGWEFQRMDAMTVVKPVGCFGLVMSAKGETVSVYVMTFAKPI